MKIERRQGSDERIILIGMVTNPVVLGRIAAKWPPGGPFASPWGNLVGGWCCKHLEKYGTPPGNNLGSIYEHWAGKGGRDKDTVEMVERFLAHLSSEYEQMAQGVNVEYTLDLASRYFNRVALDKLADTIKGELDGAADLDGLNNAVGTFGKLELAGSDGVDPFTDPSVFEDAFTQQQEPLITLPGALGNFFKGALERDAFISFMGPEKRGKTWWLLYMAFRGLLQRRRVAFFEVGDMSQRQIVRRLGAMAARAPLKPGTYKVPTFLTIAEGQSVAEVELEERVFEEGLTWGQCKAACAKLMEERVKSEESYFRLATYPNSTISVAGVRSVLDSWERRGWRPDVVVIDYADILAPPAGTLESRDQINATWKQLRAMSQAMHCLVITATQSDAASYDAKVLTRTHFSEDKRKLAHVTGMVGLNANEEEKDKGLMRLNWVVLREGEFSPHQCCHVAGCLGLGNPAMKSVF